MKKNWQTQITLGTVTGKVVVELQKLKKAVTSKSSVEVKLLTDTDEEYGVGVLEEVEEISERTFTGTFNDGTTATIKMTITVAKNFLKSFSATSETPGQANDTIEPVHSQEQIFQEALDNKKVLTGTTNLCQQDLEGALSDKRPLNTTLTDEDKNQYVVNLTNVQQTGEDSTFTANVTETVAIQLTVVENLAVQFTTNLSAASASN